jgi:anaerobic ribonucleoside-triphosphate reductase
MNTQTNKKTIKKMDEQLIQTVVERANEMLKDEKINNMYQSFKTKDEADEWLIRVALATLMIPIEERGCKNK